MRIHKQIASLLLGVGMVASLITPTNAAVVTTTSKFVQNTATKNTFGYYNDQTDQFEAYSTLKEDGISSQIYKPVSGDTLVVTFHGNGEGGVDLGDGNLYNNNYSQIAANELASAFSDEEMQEKLHGAYVLAFQAPQDWYHDHSEVAGEIINKAKEEFGIKQTFVCGLSAGGLMSQRMIATYPDMFDGALYSCAAISKNDTYVEGLGGEYAESTEYIEDDGVHKKPTDMETYLANYDGWLTKIAESNVPIFMIHAEKDPTIASYWTKYAYTKLTALREEMGNTTPIYKKILDTVNYGNSSYGEHFAWVKMLNNDVLDETGEVRSLNFIAGLSTSDNEYTPKAYVRPRAGASKAANTYKFNLIAEVTDGGAKITHAVIDMNGKKVDASKLDPSDFEVTASGEDASGLLADKTLETDSNYFQGDLMKNAEPVKVAVKDVYVNNKGNIVLKFKDEKAVLNYTGYSRNLTVNAKYTIKPVKLTLLNVAPGKVTVKNVKATKKQIKVSWKKPANAETYQVAYKKANASKWNYLPRVKATSKTIKVAKTGKYQVKVRAYNAQYGAWSAVKSVTVKK